jgi:hypothetical protein
MENDKVKRAIYIYLSGYKTGCGYTLKEYFEAATAVKTIGTKENLEFQDIRERMKWSKK